MLNTFWMWKHRISSTQFHSRNIQSLDGGNLCFWEILVFCQKCQSPCYCGIGIFWCITESMQLERGNLCAFVEITSGYEVCLQKVKLWTPFVIASGTGSSQSTLCSHSLCNKIFTLMIVGETIRGRLTSWHLIQGHAWWRSSEEAIQWRI